MCNLNLEHIALPKPLRRSGAGPGRQIREACAPDCRVAGVGRSLRLMRGAVGYPPERTDEGLDQSFLAFGTGGHDSAEGFPARTCHSVRAGLATVAPIRF